MKKLAGKAAIVTGGASGIGAAIVRRLRESGANVAVMDISAAMANRDEAILAVDVDVTDAKAVEAAAGTVAGHFGSIDILVNCAGVMGPITNAIRDLYFDVVRGNVRFKPDDP